MGWMVGVDYSVEGWKRVVVEATGAEGVHVVFDTVGPGRGGSRRVRHGERLFVVGFAGRDGVIEKIAMYASRRGWFGT